LKSDTTSFASSSFFCFDECENREVRMRVGEEERGWGVEECGGGGGGGGGGWSGFEQSEEVKVWERDQRGLRERAMALIISQVLIRFVFCGVFFFLATAVIVLLCPEWDNKQRWAWDENLRWVGGDIGSALALSRRFGPMGWLTLIVYIC
jgi:hypothetical protein